MLAGNLSNSWSVVGPYVGTLALTVLGGLSCLYFPRLRWSKSLKTLGLAHQGEGVYRGRAIQVSRKGSAVTIAIRTRNSARLYDELSSEVPVPGLPWISELAAMQLNTLAFARRVWDRWHIQLQGQTLKISCATVRPERLRFLLDLACDLADGVDAFGEEQTPSRFRRRSPA
jgi:hypothetical protein